MLKNDKLLRDILTKAKQLNRAAEKLEKDFPDKVIRDHKLPNGNIVPLLLVDEPFVFMFTFNHIKNTTRPERMARHLSKLRRICRDFKNHEELTPINPINPLLIPVLLVPKNVESKVQQFAKEHKTDKFKEIPVNVVSITKVRGYVKSFYD